MGFLLVGFLSILGKTVRETQFQTSHPCASLARRSGQRSNLEKPIRRMAQIKTTPWRHWKNSSLRCSIARCSIKQIHLYFLTKKQEHPNFGGENKVKNWKARLTTNPYFSIIDICEYMIKFQKCKFWKQSSPFARGNQVCKCFRDCVLSFIVSPWIHWNHAWVCNPFFVTPSLSKLVVE